MAYEALKNNLTFKAYGDLSSYQYHFVKMRGNDTVDICAAVSDKPIGILQNKPDAAGKAAQVMVFGVSKLVAAETLAAGDLVGTDGSGHGDKKVAGTDITGYVAGQCLQSADATELSTVAINCTNLCRITAT